MKVSSGFVFSYLCVFLFCCSTSTNGQTTNEEREFKACHGDNGDINALLGVPRWNRAMGSVSNDLGSYDSVVVSCPGAYGGEICNADWIEDFNADMLNDGSFASDNPSHWINYLQSLTVYSIFAIVFAVVSVLAGIIALILNCCCGCGAPPHYEETWEHPDKLNEDGEPMISSSITVRYPAWQIMMTYFCLLLFIILMFTFTMLAQVRGNAGFTTAQYAMIDATDGIADLSQGLSMPVISLFTSVLGNSTVNLIRDLNKTIVEEGDLVEVHESFTCAKLLLDIVTNDTFIPGFLEAVDKVENQTVVNPPSLGAIDAIVDGMIVKINTLNGTLNSADTLVENFKTGIDGLSFPTLEADISELQIRLTTLQGHVSSLSTSLTSYGGLETLVDTTVSTILPLVTPTAVNSWTEQRLVNFRDAFNAMDNGIRTVPDEETEINAVMLQLNSSIDSVDIQLETVRGGLVNAQTTMDTLPTLASLESTLDQVIVDLDAFDLDQVKLDVKNATNSIGLDLPDLNPIIEKLQSVVDLKLKIPCILQIKGIPEKINDTLLELPPEVLNITDSLDQLNATVQNATANLEQTMDQLKEFDSKFNETIEGNLDDVNAQLDQAKANLQAARDSVVTLKGQVAGTNLGSLDLATSISEIDTVRTRLGNQDIRPGASTSTQLSDAKNTRNDVIIFLDATGPALLVKVQGLIDLPSEGTAQTCTNAASECYTPGNPPIYNDAPCGQGFCFYPEFEMDSLKQLLDAFGTAFDSINNPSLAEMSTQLTSLSGEITSANTSISENTDFSVLTQLRNDIDSGDGDLAKASDDLATLKEQISNITSNFDFNKTIAENNISFDDVRAQILSMNETLNQGVPDGFEDFVLKEQGLYQLVFEDLDGILTELETPKLDEIVNSALGVEGMFIHVVKQVDNMIRPIEPTMANLEENVTDVLRVMRIIDAARDSDGSRMQEGSIYYLQQMFALSNSETTNDSDVQDKIKDASYFRRFSKPTVTGYIQEDGLLREYQDGAICLTDTCLKNSVDYFNSEPVQDLAPAIPLPMSRTLAMGLQFLLPIIIIIIACLIFCIPKCGLVLACCSTCVMPFLFIVFGGIFFPLLLMTADTCASMENVGVTTIKAIQPTICANLNGTINPNGYCVYNVSAPPLQKQIELDGPELLKSLLQGCSGSSSANVESGEAEPVNALISSFGLEASIIVQDQLLSLLDKTLPEAGIIFKPLLRSDVLNTQDGLAETVNDFSQDLDAALGCKKISAAYNGVKEPLCCEFSQALYWSFTSWYIIGFVLLFLGLPVGCCASCRLRNIQESREIVREQFHQAQDRLAQTQFGQVVVGRVVGQRKTSHQHLDDDDNNNQDAPLAATISVMETGQKPSKKQVAMDKLKGIGKSMKENLQSRKVAMSMKFGKKKNAPEGESYEMDDDNNDEDNQNSV